MKSNKPRITAVKDRPYGTYLWESNGKYLADGDGNFLSIMAQEGDLKRIASLRAVAESLGFGDGQPVFKVGMRKITDAEYDLMMERLHDGYTPDPADEYLDAIEEAQKNVNP